MRWGWIYLGKIAYIVMMSPLGKVMDSDGQAASLAKLFLRLALRYPGFGYSE